MQSELTLTELADASGLQPRTIRSWVAQGLIPGPLSRGPAARYPADQLERILAIRTMKDRLGMSLTDIRHELLIASAEQIQAWAEKTAEIAPESPQSAAMSEPADPTAALDYFQSLRSPGPAARFGPSSSVRESESSPPYITSPKPRSSGFEALERRLMDTGARTPPAAKSRSEQWLTISITPDVDLSVRGQLDPEQRARLERCADLMRDILQGRE